MIRRDSTDIMEAIKRFCDYHTRLSEYVEEKRIKSSLDRGAFVRPQDILSSEMLDLLGQKRRSNSYAYGHEQGDNELRESIASLENMRHSTKYTANNVAMMPGAWSGLEFAVEEIMNIEENPNPQKVLVIGPTLYQMFHHLIKYRELEVSAYDCTSPTELHTPTREDIDTILAENPRAIVLTNPNNPDGVYIPKEIIKELVVRAEQQYCYVIIDEMQNCHRDVQVPAPWYQEWINSPYVVRLDSPSKRYGLAEYRVGWVIADSHLLGDRMNGIVGRMSSFMGNAPRAANTLLIALMEESKTMITEGNGELEGRETIDLQTKKQYVRERLGSIARVKKIFAPDACINMTAQFDYTGTDIELAYRLMEQGTLMMPASGYGYRPQDCVLRITFAERDEKLAHGLDCLERVLRR